MHSQESVAVGVVEKLEGIPGGFGESALPVRWRDDTKVVNVICKRAIDLYDDAGPGASTPISYASANGRFPEKPST